jgi:hypothetical protein
MNVLRVSNSIILATGLLLSAIAAPAQIATGATYTLEQSVIANGGGKSDGGTFSIEGTVGQSAAGVQSSSLNFGVHGGFWQSLLAPTAAMVSISGRVVSADGSPIIRARVLLNDGSGIIRSAVTNNFGNFSIYGVEVGQTYLISASAKEHRFVPQVLSLTDQVADQWNLVDDRDSIPPIVKLAADETTEYYRLIAVDGNGTGDAALRDRRCVLRSRRVAAGPRHHRRKLLRQEHGDEARRIYPGYHLKNDAGVAILNGIDERRPDRHGLLLLLHGDRNLVTDLDGRGLVHENDDRRG